jgi:hypothetical protein
VTTNPHPQDPPVSRGGGPHEPDGVLPVGELLAGRGQQLFPGRGEPDVGPGEQVHAEPRLQLPDLPRQRRLRDVEVPGRLGEAQPLGDGDEVPQQAGVDVHAPNVWAQVLALGELRAVAWVA